MRHSVLAIWIFLAAAVQAQTFHATPSPVQQQEIALEQANECYLYFENTGTDSLQLRWKKLEVSTPTGWNIDLCDFGTCYIGIPASGTMNTAASDEHPFLKLIVQPGNSAGAAWLWFRVWENGNPDNFEDVYFSLHSPGVSGTVTAQIDPVRIFPNPVTDLVQVENNGTQTYPAQLFNGVGQPVWAGLLPAGQTAVIPFTNRPSGTYFLKTMHKTYIIFRAP